MTGFFLNGVVHDDTRTDFGLFSDSRGVYDSCEMSKLVQEDEAYRVEVTEKSNGVNILLESESRRISANLEESLERKGKGLDYGLVQSTGTPELPGEYKNSHDAIEMYADYALNHGNEGSIDMDFEWGKVLDTDDVTYAKHLR